MCWSGYSARQTKRSAMGGSTHDDVSTWPRAVVAYYVHGAPFQRGTSLSSAQDRLSTLNNLSYLPYDMKTIRVSPSSVALISARVEGVSAACRVVHAWLHDPPPRTTIRVRPHKPRSDPTTAAVTGTGVGKVRWPRQELGCPPPLSHTPPCPMSPSPQYSPRIVALRYHGRQGRRQAALTPRAAHSTGLEWLERLEVPSYFGSGGSKIRKAWGRLRISSSHSLMALLLAAASGRRAQTRASPVLGSC